MSIVINKQNWAKLIDFTYLKDKNDISAISDFIETANKYGSRGICSWLDVFDSRNLSAVLAEKISDLKKNGILLIGVVNFPDGKNDANLIGREAEAAKKLGLDEIDTVLNAEAFNKGDYEKVKKEILAASHLFPKKTKLILETGVLREKNFSKAVEIANETNISFVKTSTGFNHNISFEEKIRHVEILADIIRKNNYNLKIKMSGGLENLEQLMRGREAGADIFGISYQKAVSIINSIHE
ncbi:MAG: deoxyribose-phosphate aldolase [Parcubacteria group bacterium GW2011_GWA2_38_13b]|nr:MAG: deoxyribose-phosphate aldolase [Parcubacteria group bacterium GW2011_GWA2_38_13b]